MKTVRFILLVHACILAVNSLFAQKIVDSVVVTEFPVKHGVIYQYAYPFVYMACGDGQVSSIQTKCDSVFHIETGEVVLVCRLNSSDEYVVIIRNEKDQYISYSNLETAFVKKRDRVKQGTLIGLTGLNAEENGRQVDFMLLQGKHKLSFAKEIEYLRSKHCEPSSDYTL